MSRKKKPNSYNPARLAEKKEVREFIKDIVPEGMVFDSWADYDKWSDEQREWAYENRTLGAVDSTGSDGPVEVRVAPLNAPYPESV